jgi:hypothetical protein
MAATMKNSVVDQVASLNRLSYEALLGEWKRLHRTPVPKRISRSLLALGVAWKIQEVAFGGLSGPIKRKLNEMTGAIAPARTIKETRSTTVKSGARLVREWRGETYDVLVLENGFEWNGRIWWSLSEIAREITGTRWSGPRFFGLEKPRSHGEERAHG